MGFLNVKTNYSVYKNCMLRLGRYMLDESLETGWRNCKTDDLLM